MRKNPALSEEIEHKVRVACGLEFDDEPTGEAVDPSELGEGIVGDTNAGSSAPDVE